MARAAVSAHRSILLALVLWGALLGLPGTSVAQESITLQLDWTWWAGLIPFHVAQEKGFFADAGLSVAVQQGQGAASTVTVVLHERVLARELT